MSSGPNVFVEQVYPGRRPSSSVDLPPPKIPVPRRVLSEALLENSTTRQRRSTGRHSTIPEPTSNDATTGYAL